MEKKDIVKFVDVNGRKTDLAVKAYEVSFMFIIVLVTLTVVSMTRLTTNI